MRTSTATPQPSGSRPFSLLMPSATPPGEPLSIGFRIGISAFVLLVFGLSDILILFLSEWPHLFGTTGVPVQRWEEIVIYLPFAEAFGWSNLLPVAPGVDKALVAGSVYPWITMFFQGFILNVVCLGSTDLFLLVNHALLPLAAFWLIYLIFRGYITRTWAIALAFLSVSYYSGFHYADALAALFGAEGTAFFPGVLPEVTRMPFPSLTLPLFLLPFYLTVRTNKLTEDRLAFLSILWGLQIYVYVFNFVAGAAFFALWIIYARYMTDKGFEVAPVLRSLGIFVFLCVILAVPFFATMSSPLGQEIADKVFTADHGAPVITDWGAGIGYLFPLVLLLATLYLFRADAYELFYRYTPVLIALIVDLLVGSLHLFAGGAVDPELYYHRISHILFRFFYFLPFLYFISLPEKHIPHRENRSRKLIHHHIPNFLKKYVHRFRVVYAGLAIGLVGAFMLGNGVQVFIQHEALTAPRMAAHDAQIDLAASQIDNPGTALVFEDITPNLLAPGLSGYTSLLAGTFGNFVENDRILERLVLYARLCGWTTEQFVAFLTPAAPFAELSSYNAAGKVMDDQQYSTGLGYYLLNHRKQLTSEELSAFLARIAGVYDTADIPELLRRNPVGGILTRHPERCPVPGASQRQAGEFTLIIP